MACLYMLRDQWDSLIVLWANTGKNYPEVLGTIETVRAMVPHFVEVRTDRDGQNARNGIPSQLVPINATAYGSHVTGKASKVLIQSYLSCCSENISIPLFKWCKENGVTTIYKGQRTDEDYKSPSRDGTEVDGITFRQPLDNWTKEQVIDYLKTQMQLPDHFRFDHSSMDCYDCTAFLEHSRDRIEHMKAVYPDAYAEFASRFNALTSAINAEIAHFSIR